MFRVEITNNKTQITNNIQCNNLQNHDMLSLKIEPLKFEFYLPVRQTGLKFVSL